MGFGRGLARICSGFFGLSGGLGNRGVQVSQRGSATKVDQSSIARLAGFFPSAIRVRIPVEVAIVNAVNSGSEALIEFGTAKEVLFVSELPLEFNDHVKLTNQDGSLNAEGKVVALQFDGSRTAVAVRFDGDVANWIIKAAPAELGG
jgi:hypothetical protein